eukprot:CAMPEP_0201585470 /NCGR_PEP_ID=MMETSP0190_2-20130828/122400_1 /ASSEMBLY_ACC=CAM_ASM_000263 /TAXON_ID=37353 /ORGANISM="Rosalina sp." /LENGTH=111 /DNA_ID=CAMNT_0048031493 /DNA_START=64 /DNA_END=399 /DNA_ORIENTATION=+
MKRIQRKNETPHATTFRHFTGLNVSDTNIIGGGFSIQDGDLVDRSGTFNAPSYNFGKFHDQNRTMNAAEKFVLEIAIANWRQCGAQNTKVEDLIEPMKAFGIIPNKKDTAQ